MVITKFKEEHVHVQRVKDLHVAPGHTVSLNSFSFCLLILFISRGWILCFIGFRGIYFYLVSKLLQINIFKISLRVGSDTFLKIFPPKKCFKKFASWSLSGDIKGEGLSERPWRHISKSLRSVRSLLLWIITLSLFFFLNDAFPASFNLAHCFLPFQLTLSTPPIRLRNLRSEFKIGQMTKLCTRLSIN